MKKLFLLLIVMLCLAGCTRSGAEPVEEPEVFLNPPIIKFSTGYGYNDHNILSVRGATITEDSFEETGRSIFLDITFRGPMNQESLLAGVSLEGCDDYKVESHPTRSSAVKLQARDIEYEKLYRLKIAKEVRDLAGVTLAEDISVEIIMHPVPVVYYHYENALGEKSTLGEINSSFENVHFTQPLSESKVGFSLEFTVTVDGKQVEEAISKSFSGREQLDFNWRSDQQLELSVTNLLSNHEYRITFDGEIISSSAVIGTLFFEYYEPTKLMSYDLTTGHAEELKVFSERPAMVIPSGSVEQYFIVDDYFSRYAMNHDGETYELPSNLQFGFGSRDYGPYRGIWLDSENVLAYDVELNTILSFNVVSAERNLLFELPESFSRLRLSDVILSPDQSRLTAVRDGEGLWVFSLDGEVLYENEFLTQGYVNNDGTATLWLDWLDNQRIIFCEAPGSVIHLLNLEDGSSELVMEDARRPAVCRFSNLILADSFSDGHQGSCLYSIGEQTGVILEDWCTNPLFIRDEFLIYNAATSPGQSEIYLYEIRTKEKRYIGQGKIIGVSSDGSKVYAVKNYQNVYYLNTPG